jgi:hypothetical protein
MTTKLCFKIAPFVWEDHTPICEIYTKDRKYSDNIIFINCVNYNINTNKIPINIKTLCEKIITEKFQNNSIKIFFQFLKNEKNYHFVKQNFNFDSIKEIPCFLYTITLYRHYLYGKYCPIDIYEKYRVISHKWNVFLAKVIQKEINKQNLIIET